MHALILSQFFSPPISSNISHGILLNILSILLRTNWLSRVNQETTWKVECALTISVWEIVWARLFLEHPGLLQPRSVVSFVSLASYLSLSLRCCARVRGLLWGFQQPQPCRVGWLCTICLSVDAPWTLLSWLPCLHFCSHLIFWQFYCVWRPTWEILLSAPVIKKSSLKFDNSILIQLLVFLNTAFLSSLTKEWLQGQFDR